MAETGDLIIKIGGDASKFKATIADVENSLKSFKANLGTTGLNIKIEALGFEEAKSNIKGVTEYAEGTLGSIQNRIKLIKKERLTVTADASSLAPFNIALKEAVDTKRELEKAGIFKDVPQQAAVAENSIQGISNKLADLRKQRAIIDPDTNARAIVELNQLIEKLEEKLRNLQILGKKVATPEGVLGGFKQITKGSAEAGRALTSLSLIAQDLPFGFIAIQNNLPALSQTFNALKTETGSTKTALSALAGSLVGPAGFFFAFSAVTSLVTVAVQEYGSLSNAVKVLTSSNSEALKSQLALNKALTEESANIGGRIAQIKILVENYQREGATQLERLAAFRALKAINPDIVAGIDEQNYSTAASIKLVGENANAIINLLKVQAKQQAISKVLDGLEQKRFEANGKYNAERKKQIDFENRLAAIDAKKAKGISLSSPERTLDRQRAIGAKAYADNVKEASEEISKITTEQDNWYNSLKPLVSETSTANSAFETLIDNLKDLRKAEKEAAKGTKSVFAPQIDSQALDEAFNLDKIIANITKYGNVLIDVNKTEAERKNALRELSEINPEYFNQFKIGKSSVGDAKVQLEEFIRTLLVQKKAQEDALAAAKLNNQFRENEEKGITAVGDKYRILNDEVSTLPKTFKDVEDAYKNANLNIDKIIKPDFSKFDTSFDFDQLSKGFKIIEEQSRKIKDNMVSALSVIQGLLQDTFLQLFDEGKGNWKEFGDAAVKEIKRITAALAVKALVEGLANLLTAGISGTVQSVAKGLEGIDTASLGEWLDMTPGAANFGGIRGNQGVNMNGQVVMTLRGTDLVGAMNRTNTSINRVG